MLHGKASQELGILFKVCWIYMQAARRVKRECPGINVQVFSDRDISDKKGEIEAALQGADMFFGSLLFDYDQVSNIRFPPQLSYLPI